MVTYLCILTMVVTVFDNILVKTMGKFTNYSDFILVLFVLRLSTLVNLSKYFNVICKSVSIVKKNYSFIGQFLIPL